MSCRILDCAKVFNITLLSLPWYRARINGCLLLNVNNEDIKKYSNCRTFPQLFVNKRFLGDYQVVSDMQRTGELKRILRENKRLFSAMRCVMTDPCSFENLSNTSCVIARCLLSYAELLFSRPCNSKDSRLSLNRKFSSDSTY